MHSTSQQPKPSHNITAKDLLLLRKQQALLTDDQLAGQKLQQQIRPKAPWHAQGINFEHCVVPALYLAGDTLDYFVLPDGRLLAYLADVSGSGTAAALVSMLLKSIVRGYVFDGQGDAIKTPITPASLLTHINKHLLAYNTDRHVTLICVIIDTQQNSLYWSVAGHLPSPVLYSDGQAAFLEGTGQPVGLFEQAIFNDLQMPLPEAFSLSFFSDGIFDVLPHDNLVSSEAALPALIRTAQGNYTQMVKQLGLANCSNMPDDIAVLVLSRNLA
ncbi:serine/threonine-protein phosphatase [Pseudomonas sp. C27(2019)]|uniref:PP2C family protein-serine/threonine phosphatase n=1 Tax=Pseudomonas sp. C27(2019) TaxID=2604941 RepID=UPI00124418DD|nr:PP2C family protein-serine/threonine phosphatase [Pseudomonas sp. C27(2019)]QEY58773.1 serine/threonine-protein phosphatase [Pseudomonas sp. C27(2019)]